MLVLVSLRGQSGVPSFIWSSSQPLENTGQSGREIDQNLQSPGSLGQVQRDSGKEGEVDRVSRKGENRGQIS